MIVSLGRPNTPLAKLNGFVLNLQFRLRQTVPAIVPQPVAQSSGTYWKSFWADPPRVSPVLRLAKVCRILVANTAHWAGFADSASL